MLAAQAAVLTDAADDEGFSDFDMLTLGEWFERVMTEADHG